MAHPVYRLSDGTRIPSVTTVIGAVLAKPQLIQWANRMGLQGVNTTTYRDELANVGTQVHEWIRQHLTGVESEDMNLDSEHLEMAFGSFSRWLGWLQQNPLTPRFAERSMVSEEHAYGGTVDCVAVHPRGLVLCDWKTSKAVYDDHLYQVSAYAELLEENGITVDAAVVVHVGRTEEEGLSERWLLWPDMRPRAELFRWCLDIYRRQAELRGGSNGAVSKGGNRRKQGKGGARGAER